MNMAHRSEGWGNQVSPAPADGRVWEASPRHGYGPPVRAPGAPVPDARLREGWEHPHRAGVGSKSPPPAPVNPDAGQGFALWNISHDSLKA